MPQEGGYVGIVTRVESFSDLEALIVKPESEEVLRYGALVEVIDYSRGGEAPRYLAMVVDVRESEPHAVISLEKLSMLMEKAAGAGVAPLEELIGVIASPSGIVKFVTTVTARLRVLGRVEQVDQRARLVETGRPPRPRSVVKPAERGLLESLLSTAREPVRLGTHLYTGVNVVLEGSRLAMHLAVVGQTGSGKTETVKRIAYEAAMGPTLQLRESSEFRSLVLVDPHGEYLGWPYEPPPPATPLVPLLAEELRSTSFTVVVPYEPLLADEGTLREGLVEIASRIPRREVAVLHFAEGVVYEYTGSEWVVAEPSGVRRVLDTTEVVVAAVPHPNVYLVDELFEVMGGERESAYYAALLDVAELLEVLRSGRVGRVGLLSYVARMGDVVARYGHHLRASIDEQRLRSVLDEVARVLREDGAAAVVEAASMLTQFLLSLASVAEAHRRAVARRIRSGEAYDLLAWLGGGDYSGLLEAASSGDPASVVDRITLLMQAISEVAQLPGNTRGALIRRLSRALDYTSTVLDEATWRFLVGRLEAGVATVHLAHPSVGDVDSITASLLSSLADAAMRGWAPGRRHMIVLEEAHRFAPSRGAPTSTSRMIRRLAREGRKFGLMLVVVTQRPSGVDPDVLSQCATLVALRMTNPEDLEAVRRGSEAAVAELVDRLPDLEPGHALVAGLAVPERRVPVVARIDMLTRPTSSATGRPAGGSSS